MAPLSKLQYGTLGECCNFHPNPKEGQYQRCSNYHTIALISHANKVMLKIIQNRLQQYMNQELSDEQAGFQRGREIRDQIANIHWIMEKAKEFQKRSTSTSVTSLKPLTVWITTNCGKILKRWKYQIPTKVHLVKAMVFPVVIYGCESWTIKKAEHRRLGAFELWCWRTLGTLESPLDSKKIKPVNPKGNQPWIFTGRTDAEAEAPILWPSDMKSQLIGKDPDAGKDWRQ